LPLIVAGNRPGHEIEYPMALVIVGGLLSSTLMNLFVVPALYRADDRRDNIPATATFGSKPTNDNSYLVARLATLYGK
jgi:hypothetical protein